MSEEQTQSTETPQSPDTTQESRERAAFETYVNTSGEPVPENFKDAGEWFNSLKEAQANYTRGQQEMAELRKQYAEDTAPESSPEPEAAPADAEQPVTEDTPELRIQPKTEEEQVAEPTDIAVTAEVYEAWGMEIAATGGLSEDTRGEIKKMTGFSDQMIDDYMSGQKARARENFAKAATVVGGQEKLQQIFDWATNNLSEAEQVQVNMGLASPSYEVTLRGLNSLYESRVTAQKAAEPATNPNLATMSASETGISPYANKREFVKERNDPRFNLEPKYRRQVEERMSITDWNHLPQ